MTHPRLLEQHHVASLQREQQQAASGQARTIKTQVRGAIDTNAIHICESKMQQMQQARIGDSLGWSHLRKGIPRQTQQETRQPSQESIGKGNNK